MNKEFTYLSSSSKDEGTGPGMEGGNLSAAILGWTGQICPPRTKNRDVVSKRGCRGLNGTRKGSQGEAELVLRMRTLIHLRRGEAKRRCKEEGALERLPNNQAVEVAPNLPCIANSRAVASLFQGSL